MIFITGSTGFLGSHILKELLQTQSRDKYCLLVRKKGNSSLANRIVEALLRNGINLKKHITDNPRIMPTPGDISKPNLGIQPERYEEICEKTTQIFHCAASVSFYSTISKARKNNVFGTQNILKFAQDCKEAQGQSPHLFYTSTAYVAGDTNATVSPNYINLCNRFRNSYEQSKAEAEVLVRQAMDELAITIIRPSIIVGDSKTGITSTFNALYEPIRQIAKGYIRALPVNPLAPCDVVPVDYVARAIVNLSVCPQIIGQSFHLCSGVERETSVSEIIERLVESFRQFFARELHSPPFKPLENLTGYVNLNQKLKNSRTVFFSRSRRS